MWREVGQSWMSVVGKPSGKTQSTVSPSLFISLCVCGEGGVYHVCGGACGGLKKSVGPLELELQTGNCGCWEEQEV